jgi:hypothetical protein
MSNNKQQTGVEYLVDLLFPKALSQEQYYHIEKAKEMEKEQIMNAFDECGNWQDNYTDSEHYYNETYGGKK